MTLPTALALRELARRELERALKIFVTMERASLGRHRELLARAALRGSDTALISASHQALNRWYGKHSQGTLEVKELEAAILGMQRALGRDV